jgi:ribonucleoside-diphosphate reductase alpha chain
MVQIDLSRDSLFTEQGMSLMQEYYMLEDEKSPQEALARAAMAYSYGDDALAQRIYDYASKGWFMFASPVLSNAPRVGEPVKGLPISCFLSYVPDTMDGLIEHYAEVAWLSVKGGGVGGHWSSVRPIDNKSLGPIPHLKVVDSGMLAWKQGKTRKGSYAGYLDVSHPEIEEFIEIRNPTGGDDNRRTFNLHNAVNITDAFMEAVHNDQDWQLIDPNTGTVRDTVSAKKLWHRILDLRFKTGEPYLNFIDTANRSLPASQKELGLRINGSNLCNEIHLATDGERTAVCCLSSVNLAHFDDWNETGMVRDLIRFLDNVLQFFIDHSGPELRKAKYSAERERSIGLGAMGFHEYLQSKGIAWESGMHGASSENYKMFKYIKDEAVKESRQLAVERGEAPDMAGTGMRNAHLLAIAPNANSSILCNCSSSIEPIKSNAYTHKTRVGSHLIKNKNLATVLEKHGKNTDAVWKTIISSEGSVQHLNFLTEDEKKVYRTAFEIDQVWVVDHAAKRQEFICQGQSVNLFFPSGVEKKYVKAVHEKAWQDGLKGLYYLRTTAGVTAEKVGTLVERVALKDYQDEDDEGCVSCQG